MITFAIVDDQEKDFLEIKKCLSFLEETLQTSFTINYFNSAEAFLVNYRPIYDIVLMDIEMPDMDGLTAAKKLREIDKIVILIFVTNIAQYALNGYEYKAFDYVVKPLNKYSFASKINRAISYAELNADKYTVINVSGTRSCIKLSLKDIMYLDVSGHYVVYHTMNGIYEEYTTMKKAMKNLDENSFCYCNRFCVVNLKYVTKISNGSVFVGDKEIQMSQPKMATLEKALVSFVSRGVK